VTLREDVDRPARGFFAGGVGAPKAVSLPAQLHAVIRLRYFFHEFLIPASDFFYVGIGLLTQVGIRILGDDPTHDIFSIHLDFS